MTSNLVMPGPILLFISLPDGVVDRVTRRLTGVCGGCLSLSDCRDSLQGTAHQVRLDPLLCLLLICVAIVSSAECPRKLAQSKNRGHHFRRAFTSPKATLTS